MILVQALQADKNVVVVGFFFFLSFFFFIKVLNLTPIGCRTLSKWSMVNRSSVLADKQLICFAMTMVIQTSD